VDDECLACPACGGVETHNADCPVAQNIRASLYAEREREGRKDDAGKTRWDLVPWEVMDEVARVLTKGAAKYGDDNWELVPDWGRRYFAATLRHLMAWQRGESLDQETGEAHLAHAICCLLFLRSRGRMNG
jgi:hypothetical protein